MNNAGVWNNGKRISELTEDKLDRVLRVNLHAPFHLIRIFLPGMLERQRGHIVTVSSVLGLGGVARMSTLPL